MLHGIANIFSNQYCLVASAVLQKCSAVHTGRKCTTPYNDVQIPVIRNALTKAFHARLSQIEISAAVKALINDQVSGRFLPVFPQGTFAKRAYLCAANVIVGPKLYITGFKFRQFAHLHAFNRQIQIHRGGF